MRDGDMQLSRLRMVIYALDADCPSHPMPLPLTRSGKGVYAGRVSGGRRLTLADVWMLRGRRGVP